MTTWTLPYKPSPVQRRAHALDVDELLAGGAGGGGKSALLLGYGITHCLAIPRAKAFLFRRTLTELEAELEPRLIEWVPEQVGKYNSSKHVMTFTNGSQLRLAYLEHDKDVYRYQGIQATCLLFDELTQFRWSSYVYLRSRVRPAGKALAFMQAHGIRPKIISTTNPGGFSHVEVKDYFVDPMPPETIYTDPESGLTRAYVPFRYTDNEYIDQAQYEKYLLSLDEHLRRALMDGDWNILEGTRFPQFRTSLHTITPEQLPLEPFGIPRVVGVDYGFGDPFAAVWMAKVGDTIVVYREVTAKNLNSEQQAQTILDNETEHEDGTVALDEMAWARNTAHVGAKLGGEEAPLGSIAYDYRKTLTGRHVVKARHGPGSRVQRWAQLDRLLAVPEGRKTPRVLIYDTCRELINAIQSIPRDKRNPNDIDTNSPLDHVLDAFSYGYMEMLGMNQQAPVTEHDRAAAAKAALDPYTAGLNTMAF